MGHHWNTRTYRGSILVNLAGVSRLTSVGNCLIRRPCVPYCSLLTRRGVKLNVCGCFQVWLKEEPQGQNSRDGRHFLQGAALW